MNTQRGQIFKTVFLGIFVLMLVLGSSIALFADEDEDSASSQINDLQEDMNKALKEMKTQIDKVKSDNSDAKVSGELRFNYANPQQGSTAVNGFDLTRAYLTIKKNLSGGASMRMTLDGGRLNGAGAATGANLVDFVKYAYIELPLGIPGGIPLSATAKIGLQHNMWIDWADKIWDNAYIMKQYDDNESIMSSSDFGFGLTGKFSLPVLPEIEYHTTVVNGAGYKSAETNVAKEVGVRLNTELWKDDSIGTVILGAYGNMKNGMDSNVTTNTTQAGALLALKNDTCGTVYIETLRGATAGRNPITGTSIGGFLNLPPELLGIGLLARSDIYNPDTTGTNNELKKTVWGVFWKVGNEVRLAYDVQTMQTGNGATTQIAYVHMLTTF
jgi:hypothetical protein